MSSRVAALLLLPLLLAGCASCGRSSSTGPAPTASTAPVDRAGAPTIRTPRNLAARFDDPCSLLPTTEQLQELGVVQPGEAGRDAVGGAMCTWRSGGVGSRQLSVSIVLTGDFFVDTYRTRPLPIFRPHEVGGLPAVDSTAFEGGPTCTTTVGVADGQTLDVDVARGTFGAERNVDACAVSRRAAEEIVSTLPPL